VGSYARHAHDDQIIEMELLGAGPPVPSTAPTRIPVTPVQVHIVTLNSNSLTTGYQGLVTQLGHYVRFCPVNSEDREEHVDRVIPPE